MAHAAGEVTSEQKAAGLCQQVVECVGRQLNTTNKMIAQHATIVALCSTTVLTLAVTE